MPSAIRVRDLRKTYPGRTPVEAVRGLDLDVEAGSCFGLLGPNGAGKTTTIEILEGLIEATSGDVEVLGLRWERDAQALRERIGVTLQETKFTDKLTVLETLSLFRSFFRKGTDANAYGDSFGAFKVYFDTGIDGIFTDNPDTGLLAHADFVGD